MLTANEKELSLLSSPLSKMGTDFIEVTLAQKSTFTGTVHKECHVS